jgi:hypothetical protein
VRRVGDEPALLFRAGGDGVGHPVERRRELPQLGRARARRHVRTRVPRRDLTDPGRQLADRAQHPAGQQQRERGTGEGGQQRPQQHGRPRGGDVGGGRGRLGPQHDRAADLRAGADRAGEQDRVGRPRPQAVRTGRRLVAKRRVHGRGDGGVVGAQPGLDDRPARAVDDRDTLAVDGVVGLHLLRERARPGGAGGLLGERGEPVEVACPREHELLRATRRRALQQRDREPGDRGERERRQHDQEAPPHYCPPSR